MTVQDSLVAPTRRYFRRTARIGLAFAAVLAFAPAGFAAGAAQASALEYAGAPLPGPLRAGRIELAAPSFSVSARAEHPIRHRRPRGYGYSAPEYFASIGGGSFDPSDQPGSGLYVNGVAGTVLDQLDLGVQFSLYHRSTGGSEFVSEYTDPAGNTVKQVIQTQSVRTNLVPVMATLRVRFPVSPGVEPYLGGGLGYEWLTVEGTDGTGLDFSNDYSGFGAQAYAGVNFSVGPQTSFYGEALYNASTVNAEFFNPFVGTIVREEVDFGGAGLHGGLRFRF